MLEPRTHGGLAQFSGARPALTEGVLDLSVSVNPFQVLPDLAAALTETDVRAYPDPHCARARSALAGWLALSPERLMLGAGAAELLWAVCRTLLREGDVALLAEPCFGEMHAAVHACHARIEATHWRPRTAADDAIEALSEDVRRHRPALVSLCTPTTPLGKHVPVSLVRRLCERWSNTWFVVDQSFLGMSRHRAELHEPLPDNVIVVRSLTKELGTPGVRVGYALVPPELSARLVAQRPAWTVSAAAQAAAMCYPRLLPSLEPQLASLLEHGQQLRGNLKQLGLRPFSSDTHYCVVPIAAATAATLTSQLLSQHGIYVRDCTSFGLPDCIRVSAHPQQQRLVNALGALLKDNAGSVQRKGLR